MIDQIAKCIINAIPLPLMASIEGNLFRMMQQINMARSILTLEFYAKLTTN